MKGPLVAVLCVSALAGCLGGVPSAPAVPRVDTMNPAFASAAEALANYDGKVGILVRDHGEPIHYNATTYQSMKQFVKDIWPYTGLPPELLMVDAGTYFIDDAHPFEESPRLDPSLVDAWLNPWTGPAVPVKDPLGTGVLNALAGGHFYFAPGTGPGVGEGDVFEIVGLGAYRDWLKMENYSPRYEEGLAVQAYLKHGLESRLGDKVAVAFTHGIDPRVNPVESMENATKALVASGATVVIDAYQSSIYSDAMNTCMMAPHAQHMLHQAGFRGRIVPIGQPGLDPKWAEGVADRVAELLDSEPSTTKVSIHLTSHGGTPHSKNPCGAGEDQYNANTAKEYELARKAIEERMASRKSIVMRHVYAQGANDSKDGVLSPTEALDLDAQEDVQRTIVLPFEFWGNGVDVLVYLRESLGFKPPAKYYAAGYETTLEYRGISVLVASGYFSPKAKADALLTQVALAIPSAVENKA